jgi:hypothetical protein
MLSNEQGELLRAFQAEAKCANSLPAGRADKHNQRMPKDLKGEALA